MASVASASGDLGGVAVVKVERSRTRWRQGGVKVERTRTRPAQSRAITAVVTFHGVWAGSKVGTADVSGWWFGLPWDSLQPRPLFLSSVSVLKTCVSHRPALPTVGLCVVARHRSTGGDLDFHHTDPPTEPLPAAQQTHLRTKRLLTEADAELGVACSFDMGVPAKPPVHFVYVEACQGMLRHVKACMMCLTRVSHTVANKFRI